MTRASEETVLRAHRIGKRYPGVVALSEVDFELRRGEVHVLFGENGAGKSTLISILSGVQSPDDGSLELNGEPVTFHDVAAARAKGVSAVFQEFSLAPSLTIAENLFLGDEPKRGGFVDRPRLRRDAEARLHDFGFALDPGAAVETLSRAQQQMVEIAKAFRPELSVLILDEPTASLTDHESERLFELVNEARQRDVGIVYVTHRMAEIRRLADRITVLRDGRLIQTVPGDTHDDELIQLMTGRVVDALYPELPEPGVDIMLATEHLTTRNGYVADASISVSAGEIVGLAGLVGSGKSAGVRACFGIEPVAKGRVLLRGQDVTGASTRAMLQSGVIYLPSDRKHEGLFLMRSMRESITLPWLPDKQMSKFGFLRRSQEKRLARDMTERMELSPPNPERPAGAYSGGNQQKGMLARALLGDCQVYLFDEPSVGVDVGARASIYEQIVDLARQGHAVVIVSSELPEILHLCHRAYVFARGHVTAHLTGENLNEETVLRNMMHWDETSGSAA
jgi:ribose transport system ATP-binding protein